MPKWIAVRKQSHSEEMGLGALPVNERRAEVASACASHHAIAEQLSSLGLQLVHPQQSCPNGVHCFQCLPYVGALVIQTTDDAILSKVRSLLSADFLFIQDVTLGFMQPVGVSSATRSAPPKMAWPDYTGIQQAHAQGIKGSGVLVGVLDSGCDADHREFRQRHVDFCYVPLDTVNDAIRQVRGFDINGHGTHVTGTIAGANIGVAPEVTLMVASVIESETVKTTLDRVLVGLDWMLSHFLEPENQNKPTIINMSLGLPAEVLDAQTYQDATQVLNKVLTAIVDDFDVLVIAAIGNDGPGAMRAPGCYPQCLSVGAVDVTLTPAPFSGGGVSSTTGDTEPDIAGLGVNILSSWERTTRNRSRYLQMSGTSMAAPYVSGIAALCASANPALQGDALRRHLIENALPIEEPADRVGAGLARFT